MKRFILTAMVVLALSGPAYATGNGNNNGPQGGDANATAIAGGGSGGSVESYIISNPQAYSLSGSVSGASAKGGNQAYEGSYTGQQNLSIESPRQAPALSIQGGVSNMTCFAHIGGGVTTPFGGGQLIVPKLDDGCDSRAWAIYLFQTGNPTESLRLAIQQSDKVRRAFQQDPAPSAMLRGEEPATITPTNFGATQGN